MAFINQKKILQVVKTQFVPAVYQEKTITPQNFTPIVTADTGYAALSKVNLNGVLVDPHESYTTQTDSTVAYQKTTPAGAKKYASLDKLGGMSYKCNNLINQSDLTDVGANRGFNYDINFTESYITLSYVLTCTRLNTLSSSTVYQGWVRFYDGDTVLYSGIIYSHTFTNVNETINVTKVLSVPSGANKISIDYGAYASTDARFNVENIMLNYGQTALPYEPYFEGLRDSAVTSVVSEDTLTIPAEVQALTGYGKGINENCYNYLLFTYDSNGNLKVYFYQDAYEVDLGSLDYAYATDGENPYMISDTITNAMAGNNYEKANILCAILETQMAYDIRVTGLYGIALDNQKKIRIATSNMGTDPNAFKTAMNGVKLLYQGENTTITDITQYFDTNLIEVEPNGTTTFNNTYNQAVPSEVTYLVEV